MIIIFAFVLMFILGVSNPAYAQFGFIADGLSAIGDALGTAADFVGGVLGAAADGIVDAVSWVGCQASDSLCGTSSTFQQKLQAYAMDSCWFCGVFGDVFDIMNDIASQTCYYLKPVFLTLLGLGMLFWLLFRVGKVVLDISGQADTKLVPDVLKQVMKVMVAALMIIFYLDVFDWAISPLLQLSIGMGNQLTAHELQGYNLFGSRTGTAADPKKRSANVIEQNLCPDLQAAMEAEDRRTAASGDKAIYRGQGTGHEQVYTEAVKQSFLCYVQVGSATMMSGMAVGATAVEAWSDMNVVSKLRHVSVLWIGIILYFSFFTLFVMFPLKLFDPLMNLTFVTAMFPLWVVLWAFPFGKKYVEQATNMFFSVLVNLLTISIMAVVCVNIMNSALGTQAERTVLFQRLNDADSVVNIFESEFGLVGKGTLMTAALGYFACKLFGKTESIAEKFMGGIDFGMNKAAAETFGAGQSFTLQAGASGISGGYHATKGFIGSRFTAPTPESHTGSGTLGDSLRTSSVGAAVGRLFGGGNTWAKFKDESTGSTYRLDTKSGVNTKEEKDGSIKRYDRRNESFAEIDKKGHVQGRYNFKTGEATMPNGQTYRVDQKTGSVLNAKTGVAADAAIAADVLKFKKRADDHQADFESRIVKRKMKWWANR